MAYRIATAASEQAAADALTQQRIEAAHRAAEAAEAARRAAAAQQGGTR